MTYFSKNTTNTQNQTKQKKFMDILNIPDLCYL